MSYTKKNDDMVYVNCFYYGFYINKNELHKYNLSNQNLQETTKEIIDKNKFEIKKSACNKFNKAIENISYKFNNINIITSAKSCSNILDSYKILEQLGKPSSLIIYKTAIYNIITFKFVKTYLI